jgi:hypothetical protein
MKTVNDSSRAGIEAVRAKRRHRRSGRRQTTVDAVVERGWRLDRRLVVKPVRKL